MRRKKLHFALFRRVEELKALVQNIHKIFYFLPFSAYLSSNLLICFGDDVMIRLSGDVVIVFRHILIEEEV